MRQRRSCKLVLGPPRNALPRPDPFPELASRERHWTRIRDVDHPALEALAGLFIVQTSARSGGDMTGKDISGSRRRLLHPGLVGAGATLLIATLFTDYLYWETLLFQYNNFSGWLLTGGLILALLAAIAFVVDLARGRVGRVAWLRFAGLAVAVLLGVLNAFIHSRDAYTAVIPEGITLSAVVAVLLLVVGIGGGWSLVSHPVGALPEARGARS